MAAFKNIAKMQRRVNALSQALEQRKSHVSDERTRMQSWTHRFGEPKILALSFVFGALMGSRSKDRDSSGGKLLRWTNTILLAMRMGRNYQGATSGMDSTNAHTGFTPE